jgi:hypothetical protein
MPSFLPRIYRRCCTSGRCNGIATPRHSSYARVPSHILVGSTSTAKSGYVYTLYRGKNDSLDREVDHCALFSARGHASQVIGGYEAGGSHVTKLDVRLARRPRITGGSHRFMNDVSQRLAEILQRKLIFKRRSGHSDRLTACRYKSATKRIRRTSRYLVSSTRLASLLRRDWHSLSPVRP